MLKKILLERALTVLTELHVERHEKCMLEEYWCRGNSCSHQKLHVPNVRANLTFDVADSSLLVIYTVPSGLSAPGRNLFLVFLHLQRLPLIE